MAIGPALAQGKRVALVIGNAAYTHVPKLSNTLNDADDVAASLGRLGFDVAHVRDGRFDDMRRALRDFGRKTSSAEMAVLFFAGHGMEIGGENWLIPVDAELQRDTDAEAEALSLKSAMLQVASARHLGLVILDACRNNPFAARMTRTIRTRSVDRGLARTEPSDNVLVAYAAKEGTTAADGTGRNSPFTRALLAHIETPGLEINFLFRAVRDDVLKTTRNEQQPFVYGSLSREAVYLKVAPAAPVPSAPNPEAARKAQEDEIARRVEVERKRLTEELARLEAERKKVAGAVQPPAAPTIPGDPAHAVVPGSGKSFRDKLADGRECPYCPEMVVVPAGKFVRGSNSLEPGRTLDEFPQHTVTIARAFAVGKYEITRGEFAAFVREMIYDAKGGCQVKAGLNWKLDPQRSWRSPGFPQNDRHPVVCVNAEDIRSYVLWLNRVTGKSYRLLSEAEWEYVARAGTTTAYSVGASITARQARFSDGTSRSDARTAEVGRFPGNGWGLYDVHGNVTEAVEDCYKQNYIDAPTDGSAYIPDLCFTMVFRGGSWERSANQVRSATRTHGMRDGRSDTSGFRLGRNLE